MPALILAALMVSAFVIQLSNFKNSRYRTIDEDVYCFLGDQLNTGGLLNYNTIPYAEEVIAHGRPLPKYFIEPLFKYPPLFSAFIALSVRIFDNKSTSAIYVPLLFGSLLILVTYLLGSTVFNNRIGLLSAVLAWMDPVTIICSQKIWMETTLAFFMVLAVYIFVLGLKYNRDSLFILSGFVSGLATSVKYPGVLATGAILIYVFAYRVDLLRNKKFIFSLFMPFIILLPWVYLNYRVYGAAFLTTNVLVHFSPEWFAQNWRKIALFTVAAAGAGMMFRILVRKSWNKGLKPLPPSSSFQLLPWLSIIFLILLSKYIIHGLQFTFLPKTSWYHGGFGGESPIFYLGRLIEFSLIYFFAFSAFFTDRDSEDEGAVIRLGALIILLFFILWGNYQSRYILPAIPFLLILASEQIHSLAERIERYPTRQRLIMKILLICTLAFICVKTFYINFNLSYPNDQCYF